MIKKKNEKLNSLHKKLTKFGYLSNGCNKKHLPDISSLLQNGDCFYLQDINVNGPESWISP